MGNLMKEYLISFPTNLQNAKHRRSASTPYSNYLTDVSPLSSFLFSPVSALDVQKIIEGFKSKSSNINTYSVKFFKRPEKPYLFDLVRTN